MTGPSWWTDELDEAYWRQRSGLLEMDNRGGNGRNGDGTWPKTDGWGCSICGAMGTGGHGGGCPNTRAGHQAPTKREPQIVEREAAIVEVLRGGPLTTPALASVLYARQKPTRSSIAMTTQSLIVLERDGIVRRVPLLTGPRHWELV